MPERIDAGAAADAREENVIRFHSGARTVVTRGDRQDDYSCTGRPCAHDGAHLGHNRVFGEV